MSVVRIGWKRFVLASVGLLAAGAPLGEDGVAAGFMVLGIATVVALIQAPRRYRPSHSGVWYLFAVSLGLFLVGGVAELLTVPPDAELAAEYPGWRELFDIAGYAAILVALTLMARARLADRDRTNTLDALIGVFGVGSLVWAVIMTDYLASDDLSPAGKSVGVMFSAMTLALAFAIIRLAIGPGARPTAYYLLALAAAGGFLAEAFLELELIGKTPFPGTGLLSLLASATAFVMLGAAALHPSMAELTEPPAEATPRVTGRRLLLMTIAGLIPPFLLIVQAELSTRLETTIIIGVWALISVMVMVRVYSLARARERSAQLDRILAGADADLAAATSTSEMVEAVLDATMSIVTGSLAASISEWRAPAWETLGSRGRDEIEPLEPEPLQHLIVRVLQTDARFRLDLHFAAAESLTGVLSLSSPTRPDNLELSRLASLISDLSRALESASLREQVDRERFERRFRALVENSADIIMVLDEEDVVRFVSPAGPRLLDFDETDLLGRPFAELVEPSHHDALEPLATSGDSEPVELQMTCADGSARWFAVSRSDMRDEAEVAGFVVTASEISAQKRAELDLRRSEARFRSLVQHSSDLVAVLDSNGMISWISPSVEPVFGLSRADALDQDFMAFVHPKDRSSFTAMLARMALREAAPHRSELRVRHTDGGWRTIETTVTNLLTDPSVEGIVLNAHDVTERKELEQNLRHQTLHDNLTGIPNRLLLHDRIDQALANRDAEVAVVVIDLDDFKTVNDGLGHSVGDEVLKILSFRLQQVVRTSDTAARLGGDEFAIVVGANPSRPEVMAICKRLLRTIEEPVELDGRDLVLHASLGVAFATDIVRPTPEQMVRSADLAMYSAKSRGKARIAVFDESMQEGVFERLELKADLARALERGELMLHYQPIVELRTGAISGFEALIRWNHPVRGLVGPGTFIPLAEETGLIVPIGRWLVDEALTQLARWQQLDPHRAPLSMSINVSGRQLEDDRIALDMAEALERAGVDPSRLVVELTESVVVEHSPNLVERLTEIRSLGVGLHADDFGAGFASYSALSSLPFTGVKIDRSLVAALEGESAGRAEAQVRSIIDMATETGMEVVAEGIESSEQARKLRAMSCGLAQGFYFARPAPAEVVERDLGGRDGPAGVTTPRPGTARHSTAVKPRPPRTHRALDAVSSNGTR